MTAPAEDFPLWLYALFDLAKWVATTAAATFITIKIVNKPRIAADYLEKRTDDLCADIRAASDLASEYWQMAADDPAVKPLAVKVQTRIMLIERMRVAIASGIIELNDPSIVSAAQGFIRVTTGGEFGVHNRAVDVQRASDVHHAALSYIAAIRTARMRAHTKA
ncbi:hypothetical protein [Labrys sp. (in: a-proteobacteria)]|uniref:hypothetical protein n=1 Tax=Labrys sp. (in: a-proteobacteria) TaxID=1917972 RepID=UPI0039E6C4AE